MYTLCWCSNFSLARRETSPRYTYQPANIPIYFHFSATLTWKHLFLSSFVVFSSCFTAFLCTLNPNPIVFLAIEMPSFLSSFLAYLPLLNLFLLASTRLFLPPSSFSSPPLLCLRARAYVTGILHFFLSQVSHSEHNFFGLNGMNDSLPFFFLFLCGGTIISLRRLLLFAVLFWFLLVLNNSLPSFLSFRHHFLLFLFLCSFFLLCCLALCLLSHFSVSSGCSFSNDGLFYLKRRVTFQKRRVTFLKTTGRFSKSDRLFFPFSPCFGNQVWRNVYTSFYLSLIQCFIP